MYNLFPRTLIQSTPSYSLGLSNGLLTLCFSNPNFVSFLINSFGICQCKREHPLTYKFAIVCLVFPQLKECPAILWERLNTVC